jgi:hypothetical protein
MYRYRRGDRRKMEVIGYFFGAEIYCSDGVTSHALRESKKLSLHAGN